MPKVLPSREKGHLAVAAIRVLRHRDGKPPRPAEIAELLGWGDEEIHVVLRGLADAGILRMHETPFEVRLEIGDHGKLEDLPAQKEKAALKSEVAKFQRKSKRRKEELDHLFESGEVERKKKQAVESLEEQFEEFRKKTRRPPK